MLRSASLSQAAIFNAKMELSGDASGKTTHANSISSLEADLQRL